MKKVSIVLLALGAFLVLGCQNPVAITEEASVSSSEDRGLAAPTGTVTYLENFIDNRLLAGAGAEIGYSNAELGYSAVYIHYGFNGWQNARDVKLEISGVNNPYLWAKIAVPADAKVLDYCAYAVLADGTKLWDNNSGRDWHVPVYTSLVDVTGGEGLRAVTYIGKLSSVKLHWGRAGWAGVTDTSLTKSSQTLSGGYAKWTGSIGPFTSAEVMNYCFTNGAGAWDNNGGKDWAHAGSSTTLQVVPTIFHPDLEGAFVTGYVNGLYVGSWSLYSSTKGFQAYATAKTGDWTLVLDTIKNGVRYTGTASGRILTTSSSLSLPVTSTPWSK